MQKNSSMCLCMFMQKNTSMCVCRRTFLCVYAEEHFYVFTQKNTSMCLCRRTLLCVYACSCRRTILYVYAEEHFYVFMQKNTVPVNMTNPVTSQGHLRTKTKKSLHNFQQIQNGKLLAYSTISEGEENYEARNGSHNRLIPL